MKQGKYKYVNGQFVHESASKRWALEGLALDALLFLAVLAMGLVAGWVVFYYFYQE